ncbi:right-handed parallel beta-helix repeat-containing protein [Streptomyces sp. 7R007]
MTTLRRLLACLALLLTAACAWGGDPASPSPTPTAGQTPKSGFPNADTTGPRVKPEPHDTGNMSVRTDGMVINGWDITGSLDIYADDVTIIDSRITSANWWGVNLRPGHSGLKILHTTITAVPGKGPDNGGVDYAVSNMSTSAVEVGWCDISVFGNALSMGQGHIHDNYVHDLVPFRNNGGEWQHTDAVISGGGNKGRLVIRNNTLLNPVDVDRGASAAIGLFADTGHVSNTVIDHNLLAGGAYALYAGGEGATGITVTNNVFSTRYHRNSGGYGAVTAWNHGGSGNVWRNNRFSDGTPITPRPAG